MKTTKKGQVLRRLLELCDDLRQLRRRLVEPDLHRATRARLLRETSRKRDSLAEDLRAHRFSGPLAHLLRDWQLEATHFQVLALLLHRHLSAEEPACEGRIILANVFDSSFEILSGTSVLHETSPLRASGLMVVVDDEDRAADLLEARFQLSADALLAFREEVAGSAPSPRGAPESSGYTSHREFLVDLRILHNLYRTRAERAFHAERWNRVHTTTVDPAAGLTARIQAMWQRLRRGLEASATASDFPIVRFIGEYGLQEEETVVVVHLLFKELYEGNAYADAAELLRLVSASDADLLRNRRLFLRSGTLVSREILHFEAMIESRNLTAEVHLEDWAVNYLLGAPGAEPGIGPDERLDWHLYLRNLPDAQTFFRDLEAS